MADIQYLFNQFVNHPDVIEQPGHNGEAKGWCPWHEDRAGGKPSLGINVNKHIVKCFVCGQGGTAELAKAWDINLNTDVKPWERTVSRTHNYDNPDGTLRSQAAKFADGSWIQRRPDPNNPDRWLWNMKGTQPVLYCLPQLRAANPEEWVYIVEGEKDVDRLRELGLVATTNPMGAGKWRTYFNKELKGRKVAIIPDNDKAGTDHATKVAVALHSVAETVKILKLAGVPEKGDISDWLDDSHTPDHLAALLTATPTYILPTDGETPEDARPEWQVNKQRPDALRVTERLNQHGFFVNGDSAGSFFFDQRTKQLVPLDKDDITFKSLLSDHYQINPKDSLYGVLLEHLLVEAHQRGQQSKLRRFGYHDRPNNTVLLDMGGGQVLKITSDSIEISHNGADGVLFQQTYDSDPWQYKPDAPERLVYKMLVEPANFSNEGHLTIKQQKLLFFLWILSFAFESSMPFKAMPVIVGPNGSGKSVVLRTVGKALIGAKFNVTALSQDSKGEEDFIVAVTNSPFVAADNVDQFIRWLPDKLANVIGGVQLTKRKYFTTNQMETYEPHCMLAVTARTPTISLRREDIAARSLVWTTGSISERRDETEMYEEIAERRDELMSDFARIVQQTLRVPLNSVKVADKDLRLVDFAKVITRIGMGLGADIAKLTDEAVRQIQAAQHQFATEEDSVASILEVWIARNKISEGGQLDLGAETNNGRAVTTTELLDELRILAKEDKRKLSFRTPHSLGIWLSNMEKPLSKDYEIVRAHSAIGNTWAFTIREEVPDHEGTEREE